MTPCSTRSLPRAMLAALSLTAASLIGPALDAGAQEVAPATLPLDGVTPDPSGAIETLAPKGPVDTARQPFFQPLGTNGRTCQSCHQPAEGWSLSAAGVAARFSASGGLAPLFRPVDGAVCPTADVSTQTARAAAYHLLTGKGLLRIGLDLPGSGASEFTLTVARDTQGCAGASAAGTLTAISVYRRPLPATNLRFLSSVMWDGRYPTLDAQAKDAILDHFQAASSPDGATITRIVDFEASLVTAQVSDALAGRLDVLGGRGGATALATQPFTPGINDPANPGATATVFTLYGTWDGAPLTRDAAGARRQSIARGERLFNTRRFTIAGVGGLNGGPGAAPITGTCSTCHDTPNVGDHSVPQFLDIGVAAPNPPTLDAGDLPVFRANCAAGPLAGRVVATTDPGRALQTGRCADLSAFKVPTLRGLAARAPYFHNGLAPSLDAVVGFYDRRFRIGLNGQDRADLAAFLAAL